MRSVCVVIDGELMTLPADIDLEIWEKVQDIFADSLGFDTDEVEFQSKIIGDLEAESLDFLDIAFKLNAFNIQIPRGLKKLLVKALKEMA